VFVDADGSGHAFCGGFGDGAIRPATDVILPVVVSYMAKMTKQETGLAEFPLEDIRVERVQDQASSDMAKFSGSAASTAGEAWSSGKNAYEEEGKEENEAANANDATMAYLNRIFELSIDSSREEGQAGAIKRPPPERGRNDQIEFLNRLFSKPDDEQGNR